MSTLKAIKQSSLKSWFDKLSTQAWGYKLADKDFHAETKGMTTAQLQFVLSLTAAAYSDGAESSRKWFCERRDAEKQERVERINRATAKLSIVGAE